jgi:nucleoside-diphosphate-sugar epimerase
MKVLIIGCGYVGKAAAKMWKTLGHEITVTTRSKLRISELESEADRVIVLNQDPEALNNALKDQHVVLLSVAPDTLEDYHNTYLQSAMALHNLIPKYSSIKHILYTSSTSVYGDFNGDWVDEETCLTTNGIPQLKILIETEKVLLDLSCSIRNVCIFRLGEIIGPGRSIAERLRKLNGASLPGSGESYTNLIHLNDIKNALEFGVGHNFNGIYNLCNDLHLSRKELYKQICARESLPQIHWDSHKTSFHQGNKRVSNQKIKLSGYHFQELDPIF